jgi:hypothetical protein
MLQVSLVGYLAGGAFVNIGYWDFPFYLAAIAFALVALGAREPVRAAAPGARAVPLTRPIARGLHATR